MIKKILCFILLISIIFTGCTTEKNPNQNPEESVSKFSIQFLDVDSGNAALIQCDDHEVLINGGGKSDSRLMFTVLKNQNIDVLDMIFATGVEEKYIGGLSGALNYAVADFTLCPTEEDDSEAFSDLKKYADLNSSGIRVPEPNELYRVGEAQIDVLHVDTKEKYLVLKVSFLDMDILFLPDEACGKSEEFYEELNLEAEILVISGNKEITPDLLKKVSPETAVIFSDGILQETLTLMELASIQVFRSDLHGDVYVESNGELLLFSSEKTPDESLIYTAPKKQVENTPKPVPSSTPVPSSIPTPTPSAAADKEEVKAPFSVDELYEANLMTNLLQVYTTVQIESHYDDYTYIDGTFLVDDKIAKMNTYIYDSGECTYSGWYNGYNYYYVDPRPVQMVFIETFDGDPSYPYAMDMSNYFLDDENFKFIGKDDNDYIYEANLYSSSYRMTIDSKTKALKKVQYDGYEDIYIYDERVPGQDMLDSWYGELKAVSVYAELYEGTERRLLERTFYLPLNWELEITSFMDSVNVFMDENHTIPYSYPGDGINYSLYVTNAKG